MSQPTFTLHRYRLMEISATSPVEDGPQTHEMELKFVIGFHADAPEECDFSVTIQLQLSRKEGEDMQEVMSAKAQGGYQFTPDGDHRSIEGEFERTYAASLLYGCMRPTLDGIVNGIGLTGLNLPYSLPMEVIQAAPRPSPSSGSSTESSTKSE